MYFFSVIIPVYNAEKFILTGLKSILSQSYKSVEIILIDDCSTDSSGKIGDDFARRHDNLKVIHQPRNKGVALCRNKGIKFARGRYIIFMDSDDYLLPGSLNNLAKLIGRKPKADVIIGKFICRPEKGGGCPSDHSYNKAILNKGNKKLILDYLRSISGFSGICWRYIIRRDFLKKTGLKFMAIKIYEDQIFIAKLLCLAKRISLYNYFFYCHRTRPESLSRAIDYEANLANLKAVIELCSFLKNNNLTGTEINFVYSRIKYALDLFVPRIFLSKQAELSKFASLIKKHWLELMALAKFSRSHDLFFFLKNYGSLNGLILYKEHMKEIFFLLLKDKKNNDIYVFCAGLSGKGTARLIQDIGFKVKGFLDNNLALRNSLIMGLRVKIPEILKTKSEKISHKKFVIVCAEQIAGFKQIYAQLHKIGLRKYQIVNKLF